MRHLLHPRILSPLLLWSIALYLIHHYLLPLPVPSLSTRLSSSTKISGSKHLLSTSFPKPPQRQGDDNLDSIDPHYRPFSPLPPPEAPFPRLRPTRILPGRCLEQWFADGETNCGQKELGEEEKLDATWLWVNGSDLRWQRDLIYWRERMGVYSPERHFREQDELVHSMRSVLTALPGKIRTMHLITADFPFTQEDLPLIPLAAANPLQQHLQQNWRVAQAPIWLDYSRRDPSSPTHPFHPSAPLPLDIRTGRIPSAVRNYPTLRYAGHSEIFHLPTMERDAVTEELGEHEWREKQWRAKALPSFNSMSIESRIGWLPGLADVSLSLNDDFFLLRPHAVSDFHSPFYGSVIRFDHGYYQQVKPVLDKTRFNDAGEMGGLYHANYLLSQRFPKRLRPYFAHVPKVITRGLHHEASLMFKEALMESSSRRFRELMYGEGDVQMQWLLTSLRVERWREALLWTYVVANLGTLGPPGLWSISARDELMDMFGMGPGDEDVIKIEVHKGERWTIEEGRMEKLFLQAGWEAPKQTEFLFSSMDGHMDSIPKPGYNVDPDKCTIDLDRCFGPFWTRAEDVDSADMFKRLTFQYPECGDCLIKALVTASGPLGLSAFFPPPSRTYRAPRLPLGKEYPTILPPPHLPLTPTWHEADFSLGSVLRITALPEEEVRLREYCMKLLSRYLYLSARSVSHFHMLRSPEHANKVFSMIQDNPSVSILGLNDDIEEGYDVVKEIMGRWFEFRWPKKAVWERTWDSVVDSVEDD
ncbi:hypothetical protein TREMEDRAFT_67553 [Tremella mesenterica DSM 1558]|uniref:uncharacterized protein n=1 Tax=Tremella mesenterica (strain ATCC 24925 / CBS 8224 / DSM 1558 / NBRC 9311 / NRRL Y-6157 / RJB 2259-6 / UBC 559-6) TaxID=578456 RepID=UPI0003F494DD|nr:uncharacterized protein TREMEDRAFT_67553 [Tremella mesenterica DSM 1558]EIW71073.1 hypothetical protein TREMEDRAFT_67553 [Tremella mesenterica DSM 1558]